MLGMRVGISSSSFIWGKSIPPKRSNLPTTKMGCCCSKPVEDLGVEVNLSGKELSEMPAPILKQRNVRRLDISKNNLSLLPPGLGKL